LKAFFASTTVVHQEALTVFEVLFHLCFSSFTLTI